MTNKKRMLLVFAVLSACTAVSCKHSASVIVGSKNFTEQIILGEIAAQQIERRLHVSVERRLDLGGTLLAHLSLVKGEIDLYPEYTGTALTSVLKKPLSPDPENVFRTVEAAYDKQFHLSWLPPIGFNDSFAMVVRKEDAQPLGRQDLSAAQSRKWRLGVGYEFLTRPDGLRRLNLLYRIRMERRCTHHGLGAFVPGARSTPDRHGRCELDRWLAYVRPVRDSCGRPARLSSLPGVFRSARCGTDSPAETPGNHDATFRFYRR